MNARGYLSLVPSALFLSLALVACGGGSGSSSGSSSSSSSSGGSPSFAGTADGWASTSTGTTGGAGADAAHTYTVSTRSELIKALYPDAVIAADGSFTGTADTNKKIIYIKGQISLSSNAAGKELTGDDYLAGACLTALQGTYPTITSLEQMYAKYYEVFAPNVWNTSLVSGKPNKVMNSTATMDATEVARRCGSANQSKVVQLAIPSNTSILGYDARARLVHGNLILSAGADNIVIRNITFEDAFDFFPGWDPTDSFPSATATADPVTGCSTTAPTKCVGGKWNSNYDLITVIGASHVWIDHNTFGDGSNIDKKYSPVATWDFGGNAQVPEQKVQHHDALVDVTLKSDLVTLSYNHFKDHDKTGLLGGGDTPAVATENPLVLRVSYHHNYYQNNKQRMPRARWGQVHVFNNYYAGTLGNLDNSGPDYGWSVALTAGTASKLYVENNVFDIAASADGLRPVLDSHVAGISSSISNNTKCTNVASKTWTNTDCETHFYDAGNLLNGAAIDIYAAIKTQIDANAVSNYATINDKTAATPYWTPSAKYSYTLEAASSVKASVMSKAGAGKL